MSVQSTLVRASSSLVSCRSETLQTEHKDDYVTAWGCVESTALIDAVVGGGKPEIKSEPFTYWPILLKYYRRTPQVLDMAQWETTKIGLRLVALTEVKTLTAVFWLTIPRGIIRCSTCAQAGIVLNVIALRTKWWNVSLTQDNNI